NPRGVRPVRLAPDAPHGADGSGGEASMRSSRSALGFAAVLAAVFAAVFAAALAVVLSPLVRPLRRWPGLDAAQPAPAGRCSRVTHRATVEFAWLRAAAGARHGSAALRPRMPCLMAIPVALPLARSARPFRDSGWGELALC